MNKTNNELEKAVIQQWNMPAKELPIEYPKLMAKINGWKADDGRLFIYTKKLQVALSNAIISGKLIVRDNFTGLYLEPGLDAYKYGIIDFQDFCDWANKAGLFGVPDNALKLARAFEMPTEAYLSESQQSFSLEIQAATSPAPVPPDAPVVADSASRVPVKARRDLLTPVIEVAQKDCKDPFDTPTVWASLVLMAGAGKLPLLGVSDEGIKWQDSNDETKFFTIKSLRNRLRRRKEKAR